MRVLEGIMENKGVENKGLESAIRIMMLDQGFYADEITDEFIHGVYCMAGTPAAALRASVALATMPIEDLETACIGEEGAAWNMLLCTFGRARAENIHAILEEAFMAIGNW